MPCNIDSSAVTQYYTNFSIKGVSAFLQRGSNYNFILKILDQVEIFANLPKKKFQC